MEDYLRFGLLAVAGLILFLIMLEAYLRRRRLKEASFFVAETPAVRSVNETSQCAMHLAPKQDAQPDTPKEVQSNILTLHVFAKPNSRFASYDLLQAISAAGLQFGEMNIFHYYLNMDQKQEVLFSLASATKPGDFDLDRIGEFSCVGLVLFMDLDTVLEPEFAFGKMIAAAEQLAEDLDGELYAAPRVPFSKEILQKYHQRISNINVR